MEESEELGLRGENEEQPCLVCRYPSWPTGPLTDGSHNAHFFVLYAANLSIPCYDKLKNSAMVGCSGCSLLYQAVEYGCPDPLTRDEITYVSVYLSETGLNIGVSLGEAASVVLLEIFTLPCESREHHDRIHTDVAFS